MEMENGKFSKDDFGNDKGRFFSSNLTEVFSALEITE